MERRFLIHKTGETFTVADKTGIGIHAEVAPSGELYSWEQTYNWFSERGATPESLIQAAKVLGDNGHAELCIVDYKDEGTS